MNCKSVVTPTKTNHKLDFDVNGEEVDATTIVGWLFEIFV